MSSPRGWAEMARLQMKGGRILVVEDEDAAREGMVRLLEGQGYEVRGAASAEHADHWLSASSFDLALVDIGLPGMDGVEFLRWALRRDPTLAVKPIDPLFLMEAVRDALVLARLLRAAPEGWEEGDSGGD